MASRKSSIPVVTHRKTQHNKTTMFNNSSISAVTVNHFSVGLLNFGAYTQHFKSTMFDRQLKR